MMLLIYFQLVLKFQCLLDSIMQIVFLALLIRAPKVVGLCILHHLERDEKAIIDNMGLRWLLCMLHIQENHGLMTALAKWW